MDQTHIHLLITHLPVFGSLLGTLILGYGMWKKSNTTVIASYYVLVISALGAVVAYVTGEGAEETVENIQGVSEKVIEQHADFAVFALVALIAVGVFSLLGIFARLTASTLAKPAATVALLLGIISFGLVARTGYLGGQIRHTEIASGATQNAVDQGGADSGDDD
ncbi:hypothetical protein [Chryseobacterium sp.]|uniref:hypothetical protein n=1 Tax=Chryseobacterium sp. TaxID=1871047 RepID=UPI0011CB66F0|nr:hypothetical protein [Chryseobacterium sp.]TXF78831.1 hypothetical protein FUA25_00080 [Chryseobacterium sp.]